MDMGSKTHRAAAALLMAGLLAPVGLAVESGEASGEGPVFEAGLAERIALDPEAVLDALVSVEGKASLADAAGVAAVGLQVPRVYDEFGVVYVVGRGADILRLAEIPRVTRVAENRPLQTLSATPVITNQARDVWDPKSTSRHPVKVGGEVIDGFGVGVAIVDTGVDGTHPDLAPAMASNLYLVCARYSFDPQTNRTCTPTGPIEVPLPPLSGCANQVWVPMDHTDLEDGLSHGTGTAGTVAGRGIASDGRYMGEAPGAMLYGFSPGSMLDNDGSTLFDSNYAVEAYSWILCNHASVDPPIRVVENAWGDFFGGAYDPEFAVSKAVNRLVAEGLVVVFAVGNDSRGPDDGTQDRVGAYAKNPTPGVIGVANYRDEQKATRAGNLSAASAGGKASDPATNWPDLAVASACVTTTMARPLSPLGREPLLAAAYYECLESTDPPSLLVQERGTGYGPFYDVRGGTSQASAALSGIVALLFQANTALTPAEVEDVLEDTAIQFARNDGHGYVLDPSNPTTGINFAAGHGLVNALAALQDPRVLGPRAKGSPQPQLSQDPHVYVAGVDAQVLAGVPPDVALQWTVPAGQEVTLSERHLQTGNGDAYPLFAEQNARFRVSGPNGVSYLCASVAFDPGLVDVPENPVESRSPPDGWRIDAAHTFPAAGTYAIEPQVHFGKGYVASDRFVVRVVAGEALAVAGAARTDRLTPVAFGACPGAADDLALTWAFGDGVTSADANPTHTYTELGTFQPTLTTSDGEGGVTVDSFAPVTVVNLKPVAAGLPSSLVANRVDAVSFEDASTDRDGSIAQRDWDFGDGGASGDAGASHTYARLGTFGTSLTVMDNDGDSAGMVGSVEVVNLLPSVGFAHSPSRPMIVEPVQFDGTASDRDGSIVSWHWDFGDGEGSEEQDPIHVFLERGHYDVTLTVTDNDGGVSRSSRLLIVCSPIEGDVLVEPQHVRVDVGGCVTRDMLPV
jgi:serine protease AprX